MGSYFHDWIDYNGVANCRDFVGKKILAGGIYKWNDSRGKKSCYRNNCSAVDLIFTSCISFRFEITIKRLYVQFLHKQKVTKLGSLKLYLPISI